MLKVYRFLSKEEYANDFADGRFRISTLNACRAYEDPLQGDPGEGTLSHQIDETMSGSFEDKEFVQIAAQVGVKVGAGADVKLGGVNRMSCVLVDSYLLCATNHFAPELLSDTFGKYCVEISDAVAFGKQINCELKRRGIQIRQAWAGNVIYTPRETFNRTKQSGNIGFVKPADPYEEQREFRFIYVPQSSIAISPMFLDIPTARAFCRRIA